MHYFKYKNKQLYCEGVPLTQIAEDFGTPVYVYSQRTLLENYAKLSQAFAEQNHKICYAVKANSNINILKLLVGKGSYFDIVSAGELYRVLQAGGSGSQCIFAGVGKTHDEIKFALDNDIFCFNVESFDELENIDNIAKKLGKIAPVSIRVNPNVDAKTHRYISTGKSENKFGIDINIANNKIADYLHKLKNIKLTGIQAHIGSQITKLEPFENSLQILIPVAKKWQEKFDIKHVSIGGGLGIAYENCLLSAEDSWASQNQRLLPPSFANYAKIVKSFLKGTRLELLMEPGRSMVGNAGVLLTKVLYEKQGDKKLFKIVDSAMNDLIRPALYEGYHEILPLDENDSEKKEKIDIVGPVCESGDCFCRDREIANVSNGGGYAVMSAGAYGFTMASNYNSRPLPAEILVDGKETRLIRKRQDFSDLVKLERI